MQVNRINQLLNKYFEGSTSVNEELELKTYFSGNEIEQDHLKFQSMFRGIKELSSLEKNQGLHEKILSKTNDIKIIANTKQQKKLNIILIAVAAAIWIILMFKPSASKWDETYDNPELARTEVEKTLLYVSVKYNKGIKQLEYLSKINQSLEPIQESFSTINSSVATFENSINFKRIKQNKKE